MDEVGGIKVKIIGDDSDLQKKLADSSIAIAKWGAATAAAAAAVTVAMTKAGVDSVKEIKILSQVANTSAKDFQQMAYAAKSVGIEQDKLADILKDVNDRLGDFKATGGGAMVDFFDNIAPKVGVTYDQFKKLSGKEALQLYVESLEKANLSQADMTFYMEAIAGDSTRLLPLLKDNSKALNEMAGEAERLGLGLSAIDAQKVVNASNAMGKFGAVTDSVQQRLAVEASPYLTAISNQLMEAAEKSGGFQNAIEGAFDIAIEGAAYLANAMQGIEILIKGLEIGFDGFAVAVTFIFSNIAQAWETVIDTMLEGVNVLIRGMNNLPMIDMDEIVINQSSFVENMGFMAEAAKEQLDKSINEMVELAQEPMPADGIRAWAKEVKEQSELAAQAMVDAQTGEDGERNASPIGMTAEEMEAKLEKEKELNEALHAIWAEHFASKDEIEAERLELELEKLAEAHEAKLISEEEYLLQKAMLEQKYMEEGWQRAEDDKQKTLAIEKAKEDAKRKIIDSSLSALTGLMNSGSKEMFNIGKAAAIAQASVKGAEAIQSAWAAGMSVGGPAAPAFAAAYAGAAAITSGMQISQIASQSYGSKGSATSYGSSGTPVVNTQQATSATTPTAPEGGTLTVQGLSSSSLFTGDAVQAIAEELLDYQSRGGMVVLQG